MGDGKRDIVMSKFISRNYPTVERILCVADGKGTLGERLEKLGYDVTVIDPVVKKKKNKNIKYIKKYFTEDFDVEDYDLLIGMHPDEATVPIIKSANKNNKFFAIVPCCIVGPESENIHCYFKWLSKLRQLCNGNYRETDLEIKGMKRIIYRTRLN